jgi:hypothetical protein
MNGEQQVHVAVAAGIAASPDSSSRMVMDKEVT